MQRKLIKQGAGLTIYLPKKWLDKNKLNKGDNIEIKEIENRITITNEKINFKQSAVINIENMDRNAFIKTIVSHYERGCYEIIIKKTKKTLYDPWKDKETPLEKEIEFLTNRLVGFEIISIQKDKITIKDISMSSAKEFDNVLRRIFLLILEYQKTIKENIDNNSKIESSEEYHDNITKLISFCIRLLNISQEKTVTEKINLHTILTFLDKITDQLRYLATHYNKQTIIGDKKIIFELMQYFRDYYNLFYKYDLEIINKLDIERKKIKSLTLKNKDSIILEFTNILEYIQGLIKPTISLNFN